MSDMEFPGRRHDRPQSGSATPASQPLFAPRDWLSLRRNVRIPGPDGQGMVLEPGECNSTENSGATRIRIRDFTSHESDQVLPTAEGRAVVRRARALSAMVHGIAARAIAHSKKSQEGRRTPIAERKDALESKPARGLDLGTSVGVHG